MCVVNLMCVMEVVFMVEVVCDMCGGGMVCDAGGIVCVVVMGYVMACSGAVQRASGSSAAPNNSVSSSCH